MSGRARLHSATALLASAILALATVMILGPAPARSEGAPRLTADLTPGPPDSVELTGWTAGSTVTITVDTAGVEPVSTVVDELGNGWGSFPDGTLHVGSVVTATDGTTTKDLTMVEVRQEYLDAQTDVVAGVAPPNAPVTLVVEVPGGPWLTMPTTADGAGRWSVALGPFDLENGVNTHVDTPDADGDATRFGAWVHRPFVSVDLNGQGIAAHQWVPGTTVNLSIDLPPVGSPDETASIVADSWGGVYLARSTPVLPAGAVITASGGGWVKQYTVVEMRPEYLNATEDVIAGFAPDGTEVHVSVWPPAVGPPPALFEGSAVAGATSRWVLNLAPFDLLDGQTVRARVDDEDGDESTYWLQVQRPWIFASTTYGDPTTGGPPDCFWLNGWTRGTPIHAEVRYLGDPTVDWSTDMAYDPNASGFCLGTSGRLTTGSVVTASGGGWAKVLQLVEVRAEYVDSERDVVAGVAPAGTSVRIDINPAAGGPPEATAAETANGDGWWRHDFGADGVDVPEGGTPPNQRVVSATVADPDGDQTGHGANVQRPVVNATVGAGPAGYLNLTGWSDGTPITITVDYDGGGTVDDTFAEIGRQFGPHFVIPNGHGPLRAGSVVTATANHGTAPDRWQKILAIEPLTVDTIDVATDVVSGTGPAGRTVTVEIIRSVPGPPPSMTAVVPPDGSWTADFTGVFDILAGMSAQVFVTDGDGDRSGASLQQGPSGPRIQVAGNGNLSDGQTVQLTGSGWPVGPGYTLNVSHCAIGPGISLSPETCDPSTTTTYPVASDGTAAGPLVVHETITTAAFGEWDCRLSSGENRCGLVGVVWGSVTPGSGMPEGIAFPSDNPLMFGGGTMGPSLDVVPSNELVDGQVVHLSGHGWPVGPDYMLDVTQCRTDMGLSTSTCDPTTAVHLAVAADGTAEGDTVVRRVITTGSGTVDCSTTPCGLVGVVWGAVPPGSGMPMGLDFPWNNPLSFASLVAVDDTVEAREGMGPVSVMVLANDIGPSGMVIVDHGDTTSGGTVTCTETACEYTAPLDGLAGTDTFTYTVSDGGSLASAAVTVTVLPNASVVEGSRGKADLVFTIRLAERPLRRLPALVVWCTESGTAQPAADYRPKCATVTFPRGATTMTFVVTVIGDRRPEGDEHVLVRLVGFNAVVSDPVLTGVILDDD